MWGHRVFDQAPGRSAARGFFAHMPKGFTLSAIAIGLSLIASPVAARPMGIAHQLQHDVDGGCPVKGTLDIFGQQPPVPHVIVIDVPNPGSSKPHRFYIDDRDAEGLDDLVWDDFVQGGTWHNRSHGIRVFQETWAKNGLQRGNAASLFTTGVAAIDQQVPSYMRPDDPCDEDLPAYRDRLIY